MKTNPLSIINQWSEDDESAFYDATEISHTLMTIHDMRQNASVYCVLSPVFIPNHRAV